MISPIELNNNTKYPQGVRCRDKNWVRHLTFLRVYFFMKKFILAMRDLKTRSNQVDVKLVWNNNLFPYTNTPWLVTTVFSKKFIESKNMEVVYG